MNAQTGDASYIQPITELTRLLHERRVREAQQMFRRTLASWASDLLLLRSRGLRAIEWTASARRDAA